MREREEKKNKEEFKTYKLMLLNVYITIMLKTD